MSLRLDLLRHGETERGGGFRGSLDDNLTPQGWATLEAAVGGQGPWDVIVSSPLRRCAAFAEHLSAALGVPMSIVPGLKELHFGEWEGKTAAQLMEGQAQALGRFWQDPFTHPPPGGEPLRDFIHRVEAAVEILRTRHPGQRLLLVGHAGVIRLLLARARGRPAVGLLEIEVAHGALHRLVLDGPGQWRELT
ncbi:histidine phosphatase family protein [Pseudomonas massiliensis]|uniref:histidine phosphatase family protein n=1 Tax=Pseudomonas massiliensis TaxID=522492 RepID=UPI000ABB47DE